MLVTHTLDPAMQLETLLYLPDESYPAPSRRTPSYASAGGLTSERATTSLNRRGR